MRRRQQLRPRPQTRRRSKGVMSRLLILGASGSLGRHVLRQAVAAGYEVTVFVRSPSSFRPTSVNGRRCRQAISTRSCRSI